MSFPFAKVMYILTFPCLFGKFLRGIWDAVSQANILIWPQIKLNLQLPRWEFFFLSCRVVTAHGPGLAAIKSVFKHGGYEEKAGHAKETETEQNCFSCH